MKDQLSARAHKLWQVFQSFTAGQKAVTIAAIAALAIGGYVFATWAATPSYAPLFTNLAAADASAIVDKLNTTKTPYQLGAGGTEILVPQKDVYALRLTMSSAGLPNSSASGYSMLDKEGVTTSQFKQNVDFQRAEEGELDKTIMSIDGVTDAQVHLAVPQDSVFNDGSQKTTASVLLSVTPGTSLASGQVQSVVNLVSGSIPNLSPNNVNVSDSSGAVLYNGSDKGQALSDTQATATSAMNTQLAAAVQSMLDKITGAGHATVTVNSVLNFDQSTITTNQFAVPSGAPLSARAYNTQSYGGGAGTSGGVVGATSATPTLSAGAGRASGPYVSAGGTDEPALNQTQVSTSTAPGSIKALNVSVLVDKNVAGLTQTQVENMVSSAVGINKARGDQLAVNFLPFNTSASASAALAASKAATAAVAAQKSAQLVSMIKTGLIVAAVVILMLIVFISNRRRRKVPEAPDDLDLFLAQLNENPAALPPAPVDIIGPLNEDALNTVHHQKQLSEMADEDPDEVARLLRSWLNSKDG